MSTATAPAAPAQKRGAGLIKGMQKIGRSLQLPVAALPAAGILSRLGQDDVFGKAGLGWNKLAEIFAHAGGALFDNLALLFCLGVAIGFATAVAQVYPVRGAQLKTVFLAVMAINQVLGPILFRMALARSGEIVEGAGERAAVH